MILLRCDFRIGLYCSY